jgi:hypothetical protein
MPISGKLALQRALLEHMVARRRRPFRGPVALDVRATTTERTPTHAQTIAKNLLDLLGRPLTDLTPRQRGLLYLTVRRLFG